MELLPAELRAQLPPLYAQEKTRDPMVYIKYFTPDSGWTWFVTEGSEEEGRFLFFGYVIGHEREWGYFSLADLQTNLGPMRSPIERDLYFAPKPLSEALKRHE